MIISSKRAWMVRAGNENEIIEDIAEKSIVAIGWGDLGDVSKLTTRDEIKRKYKEVNPGHSSRRVGINAGQVFRFAHKIKKGDIVLTYDKSSREILIGEIKSDYEWKPEVSPDDYPHVREAEWEKKVSRDEFSTPARNSLGSTLTVFSLDEHIAEIKQILKGEKKEKEEEAPPYFEEVQSKAEELISDRISKLDPYDFQNLVAAVLQAMGFQTKVSSPGPDRGVDILAHPDALGFEPPFIKVQVKHKTDSTGIQQIQRFIGTLGESEKGLYVSTGGYTRDAKTAARETRSQITLLDRDDFIDLLLEHYACIEPEYQALIPGCVG